MLSFDNTKVAFANKNDKDLKKVYFVFKLISIAWLNQIGTTLLSIALKLKLPVKGIVRATVFNHFCGGESINGCTTRIKELAEFNVGTILDYSVEGKQNNEAFEVCLAQLLEGIERAKTDADIPFCVVKLTGLIPFELLEKVSAKQKLSLSEKSNYDVGKDRVHQIAAAAVSAKTPFMIDAEESWIQDAIDDIAYELMREFNKKEAFIYNTTQMYRHDRLAYVRELFKQAESEKIFIGLKVVRGAYMEKERERAQEMGYPSPIQVNKAATDADYDATLEFCMSNIDQIAVCCGTHNEMSSMFMTQLMEKNNIPKDHKHCYFAQLLGMSDHISFNLSRHNYNVAKYVPYGPVKEVMPYLIRRANENTSISGQTGRELGLIIQEIKRRKSTN